MCRPGACDFELVTPDNFDIYGLVIRTDALLRAAEHEQMVSGCIRLASMRRT